MEQLINIIIILVIIGSVLKRIRELGETQKNLDKSPPQGARPIPGPQPPPEARPLAESIPQSPEITEARPVHEPAAAAEERFPAAGMPAGETPEPLEEPSYRKAGIPDLKQPAPDVFAEDSWEKAAHDIEARIRESRDIYRKSKEQAASVGITEPGRKAPEKSGGLDLRFSGRAVINGIVMSEILGPPKGLRKEN